MGVLKALAATLAKMFAADLVLSLIALAVVVFCAAGLRTGLVPAGALPFLLGAGVLVALAAGVVRGARP